MKRPKINFSKELGIAFGEMQQNMADATGEAALHALTKLLIALTEQPNEKLPSPVLLRLVLAPEMAEDVIANLDHYYKKVWRKKHSPFVAKSIFYAHNARVIHSHYGKVIRDTLELYLKRS